jgi:hypothetical protein
MPGAGAVIAIIGAGPYGLSLAAHLAARHIEHRVFGRPMLFWSRIAEAGGERYLKSYCFGTNISTPAPGFSFADYNTPRGLETFEPCSIEDFSAYGHWFQKRNVPWVEAVDVALVAREADRFAVVLATGERFAATRIVIATGLAGFDHMPSVLSALPPALATHTSKVASFTAYKGRQVAVIGAGQSALEAAALLRETGAQPELLVRKHAIRWHHRTSKKRSLWRRLRSPISALGSGPTAWALTRFPGAVHRMPDAWRTRFVQRHLPAEGAWWLRDRVENRVPMRLRTTVVEARATADRVTLRLRDAADASENTLTVDHVIAGSGYVIDVRRLDFLHPDIRRAIRRHHNAPALNAAFEASIAGMYFIGPASAMSFGPLFRFVAGAEHTARMVSARLAERSASAS